MNISGAELLVSSHSVKSTRTIPYLNLLDMEQAEIDLYRQFSAWYGYVFYVGQA